MIASCTCFHKNRGLIKKIPGYDLSFFLEDVRYIFFLVPQNCPFSKTIGGKNVDPCFVVNPPCFLQHASKYLNSFFVRF